MSDKPNQEYPDGIHEYWEQLMYDGWSAYEEQGEEALPYALRSVGKAASLNPGKVNYYLALLEIKSGNVQEYLDNLITAHEHGAIQATARLAVYYLWHQELSESHNKTEYYISCLNKEGHIAGYHLEYLFNNNLFLRLIKAPVHYPVYMYLSFRRGVFENRLDLVQY